MKVYVVGPSGKLGRYMVQHALDRGYEVTGAGRENEAPAIVGRSSPSALAHAHH